MPNLDIFPHVLFPSHPEPFLPLSLSLQFGFFKQSKQEDKVPSYSAVHSRREERVIKSGTDNWKNLGKNWMATWHKNNYYS